MQYNKLGRTGLDVSRVCLGTAPFGLQTDKDVAHQILDKAADAGVNFLDTADAYPMGSDLSLVGRTEQIVGDWLRGKRDRFIVATKAGVAMGPSSWDQGGSRKHLLDAIDGSLTRLGTEYVDLYQLHVDDPGTPLDETLEALDTIVRTGKARYIGVSNFLAYRLARAIGPRRLFGSPASAPFSPATACYSGKSNANCCPWQAKRASRSSRSTPSQAGC